MRQLWQGQVVTKWGPALTGPLIVRQESPIKLQGPCAETNVYSRIGHQEQQNDWTRGERRSRDT